MVAQLPRTAHDGVSVVPMRRRHLREVLGIERVVYPRPWSPGLFAAELRRGGDRCYVVAVDERAGAPRWWRPWRIEKVVGYAGIMVAAGEAHVTTVAVHPEHHRRKIATRLLLVILGEARARGADAATLEVRVVNRGAQQLYAGFGFAPVGIRPGYYAETGEDALIMWAHDVQGGEFGQRLEDQARRLGEPGGSSGVPDLHVPWVQGRVGLPDEQPGATGPGLGRDPQPRRRGGP